MPPRLGVRHAAVLAALTALTVALVPTTARAESVVVEDAVGDVVTLVSDPFLVSGSDVPVPAPDSTTADITSTTVDHRFRRLDVTMAVRDVRRSFSDTVVMRVRTPQRGFTVWAERRGSQTVTSLAGRRSELTCRRLATTVDRTTDTIRVSLPTACIGDPRWVQVGVILVSSDVHHDPETGDEVIASLDDPFSAVFDPEAGPRLGPQVVRG